MNKRLLLCGSIIAVVVLVLAGLNPVVSFNTTKSSAKDSPLFQVRTQRALDNEQNIQTYTFLGKGKVSDILFPSHDSKTVLLQKAISLIDAMDDESFDKLVERIIYYVNQDSEIDTIVINDREVEDMLYQLRGNSEIIKNNFMGSNYPEQMGPTIVFFSWECILAFLLAFLMLPFVIIITIIRLIFDIIRFIFEEFIFLCEINPSLPTMN